MLIVVFQFKNLIFTVLLLIILILFDTEYLILISNFLSFVHMKKAQNSFIRTSIHFECFRVSGGLLVIPTIL